MSSRFSSRSACASTSAGGLASSSRVRKLRDLFLGAGVAFAELALDGLELFAQIGLALCIAELRLHILLELLLDLRDLELRGDAGLHGAHAFAHIEFLEDRLFLREVILRLRREKIGELLRDPRCCERSRQLAPARPASTRAGAWRCRANSETPPAIRCRSGGRIDSGRSTSARKIGLGRDDFAKGKPPQPLHDHNDTVVRLPQQLQDEAAVPT